MTMTFSADASGTFGTIKINGIAQVTVHNDGSIKTAAGKLMASAQGILGTVGQSGGLPTGAIVERGSNANGEYVKFVDGLLMTICPAFTYTAGIAVTKSHACVFIAPPVTLASIVPYTAWEINFATYGDINAGYFFSTANGGTNTVMLLSIGRWF